MRRLYSQLMSYLLRQPPQDLFGEVVVTEDDLIAWVRSVSPVHLTERLFRRYVKNYSVADKVRAAKLQGRFEFITAHTPPPYHARLALHQIV